MLPKIVSYLNRLSIRLALIGMALVVITMLLWLNELDSNRRETLLAHRGDEEQDSMRLHASRFAQTIETLRQDTRFLSRMQPVSGIVRASGNRGIDPGDNHNTEIWRQHLRDLFTAFATTHPAYIQLRYIGAADGGRDLVRVERQGSRIVSIGDEALGPTSDRDYFTHAIALENDAVYLSEFNLKRENGAIQVPHIATLRAATPVFDAEGQVFGVIVINMNLNAILDSMRPGQHDEDVLAYVADEHGNILLHPQSQREFGWELGLDETLAVEFPQLHDLFTSSDPMEMPLRTMDGPNGALHMAAKRVPFDPSDPARFLVLLHAIPDAAIEADLVPARAKAHFGVLIMLLVVCVILFIGLRLILRPLHQLTAAADAIARGARNVPMPDTAGGEMGALAQAFQTMQTKVKEHEADLEERVRKRTAELQLAASVVENTSEGVMMVDQNTRIVSVNAAFTMITGYSAEEAVGQKPSLLKSDRHAPEFYQQMWQVVGETGHWQGEVWNRRKDNAAYLEWLTINRIDGIDVHYVGVFHDVTEMRLKDEHIRHQAFHDALTELPNRLLFQDRLRHAIERALREDTGLAVMFIDLDRFKNVNDTLGHDVGDMLLKEVAVRLKARLRSMDTVARLGGDEFVVLLEDTAASDDCADIAEGLVKDVALPMSIRSHAIQVGASIGIALCPEDGCEALELMKRADVAMYAAKSGGRNTYRFFQQQMTDQATQHHNLEMELRNAIANQELELYYQPKVSLGNGRFDGVEALVRWRHPKLGLVSPADFIPIAEETGMIIELGDWVLDKACSQATDWQARGLEFVIAVNVSAKQLRACNLVQRIADLTAYHKLSPTCLQIELTESVLMADPERAIAQLQQLRTMGITIAVDDFGTGYSSLAYLRRLPIDVLKIDRSFIMNADHDKEDAQIVRTIVSLGKSLNLTIVAEGVETEAQAEMLWRAGCDLAQGYLYARPVPPEKLEAWLAAQNKLV